MMSKIFVYYLIMIGLQGLNCQPHRFWLQLKLNVGLIITCYNVSFNVSVCKKIPLGSLFWEFEDMIWPQNLSTPNVIIRALQPKSIKMATWQTGNPVQNKSDGDWGTEILWAKARLWQEFSSLCSYCCHTVKSNKQSWSTLTIKEWKSLLQMIETVTNGKSQRPSPFKH